MGDFRGRAKLTSRTRMNHGYVRGVFAASMEMAAYHAELAANNEIILKNRQRSQRRGLEVNGNKPGRVEGGCCRRHMRGTDDAITRTIAAKRHGRMMIRPYS